MHPDQPGAKCPDSMVECSIDEHTGDTTLNSYKTNTYRFRPGLILAIRTSETPTTARTSFHIREAPVLFGFLVRGANHCVYTQGAMEHQSIHHVSGSNGIRYLPDSAGCISHRADDTLRMVSIMAAPDVLAQYMQGQPLPARLQAVLNKPKDSWLYWQGRDTPTKRFLLTQILDCTYTGPMRSMFLESKTLELLSCQLDDYIRSHAAPHPNTIVLTASDRRRIQDARDRLLTDLENPPSISELAGHVGLNTNKLKQGFRLVFDSSVFGYFRAYRLDKARKLLESGEHNVTQAALTIGYTSLSHFSRAFANRFGMTPKECLHSQGRKAG